MVVAESLFRVAQDGGSGQVVDPDGYLPTGGMWERWRCGEVRSSHRRSLDGASELESRLAAATWDGGWETVEASNAPLLLPQPWHRQ
jgi:hypothetical protein